MQHAHSCISPMHFHPQWQIVQYRLDVVFQPLGVASVQALMQALAICAEKRLAYLNRAVAKMFVIDNNYCDRIWTYGDTRTHYNTFTFASSAAHILPPQRNTNSAWAAHYNTFTFASVCISLGWQAGAGSHAAHGACGGVWQGKASWKKKKSILGCSYKKSVRTNEHSWAVPMNRMMFWRQSWCLLAPLVMRCCKVLLVYQSRSATREEMRCGVIAGSWYGHSSCFAYDADTNQDWRRE